MTDFIVTASPTSQEKVGQMIIVDQISKQYVPNQLALDNVSLKIGNGVFGLLGPNGAGKTTLMRILATLIAPTTGYVSIKGYNVLTHPHEIRRLLGYVPQEFQLYPHLSAWEFLDYMAILSGMGHARRGRIDEVLHQVGLAEYARRPLKGFSGGMKQRVAIAQALLHKPEVLIVDEPTAGLDPGERIRFRNLLVELGLYSQVLLSTHIVSDITATCAHLAVLKHGKISFHGAPPQMIALASQSVWQTTVPSRKIQAFQRDYTIVSSVADQNRDTIRVRFVTHKSNVPQDAEAVEPTLEDAYLILTGCEE